MAVSKLQDVGSFDALFDSLDADPRVRGRQFEEICKWYLENSPDYHDLVAKVWPWREWEHAWGIDAGIDLVVEDVDGRLWAVQAKAYHPAYAVTKKDVDKFLSESSRKQFSYRLLIATTDKLHHVARKTINAQEKHVGFIGRADLLTAAVDWPKSPAVLRPAKPRKPARPHDYQREAIRDVVKGFKTAERGQLIMACGTGKTLTSLFIKEKLAAERTLVLLPSLSLLKQTMSEWRANAKTPFRALPVCSDESVNNAQDAPVAHTSELGLPDVTTDPAAIAEFLRRPGPRVLFSTYQSSPQVAASFKLGGVPEFDLAFADEAHRVAGDDSTVFATILDADAIKAKRRLFMTATPRYYTGRVIKAAQESEMVVASMDDRDKFGEVFHRLSFGEAITLGRLTDYQVAVIAVDPADETYRLMAETGALLKRDGKQTDGHTLASQIGLAKAMRQYSLRRVISFHSTIARARKFAAEMPDAIDWMPRQEKPSGSLWTGVATGEMTAGERHLRLQRLRHLDNEERGLLTNARCLSEGVDVPTLDGVAFIDPRGSEVDIIQAVGRAIRLAEDKTIGTIVIPVYIDSTMDPDTILKDSSFKAVWRVVKALRAHDEDLAKQIDSIRREMGRGGKPRLPDKIRVDVPATVGVDFAAAFDVQLVESTTQSWEFWFGLLQQYVDENGHARVPADCVVGRRALGGWVGTQRALHSKKALNPGRQQRLEKFESWSWDVRSDQWEQMFGLLKRYAAETGTSMLPKDFSADGVNIGIWAGNQRRKFAKGALDQDRQFRLEQLPGWSWELLAEKWESAFRILERYSSENGSCRIPDGYSIDGVQVSSWVVTQRSNFTKGALSQDRQRRLAELPGWSWNLANDAWESAYAQLAAYVNDKGDLSGLRSLTFEGINLASWATIQRTSYAKGAIRSDRVRLLEAIPGWSWDPVGDAWERAFAVLFAYVEEHGHSRVPQGYEVDGVALGDWVTAQRGKRTKGKLPDERRLLLEASPGWEWDPKNAKWDNVFAFVEAYAKKHGNCRVPPGPEIEGTSVRNWVITQRRFRLKGMLSEGRRRRLARLPGWSWDLATDAWENAYSLLQDFVREHGHPRMPQSHEVGGFRLGVWITIQRGKNARGKLSQDRKSRLEGISGWSWDPADEAWEGMYSLLDRYAKEHGDALVPDDYRVGEVRLGNWVSAQRMRRLRGTLSEERQHKLEKLPAWSWDPLSDAWERAFALLERFVEQYGHARVPQSHRVGEFKLGSWVTTQRSRQARGVLSPDRRRRLEELPKWSWNLVDDAWEEGFSFLVRFAEANGHTQVPRSHHEGDFALGSWVSGQQRRKAEGVLSADRQHRLGSLPGWVWSKR